MHRLYAPEFNLQGKQTRCRTECSISTSYFLSLSGCLKILSFAFCFNRFFLRLRRRSISRRRSIFLCLPIRNTPLARSFVTIFHLSVIFKVYYSESNGKDRILSAR